MSIYQTTDHSKIEKVYSIWICNDYYDTSMQNTVSSYSIIKTDEIGTAPEPQEDYDLMTVIIIRRGPDFCDSEIFDYLTKFFTSDVEDICKYVNIRDGKEIMEGVRKMPGMGKAIYDKGVAQGIEQGKINTLLSLVREGIISNAIAAKEANMSEAEFSKLLEESK